MRNLTSGYRYQVADGDVVITGVAEERDGCMGIIQKQEDGETFIPCFRFSGSATYVEVKET